MIAPEDLDDVRALRDGLRAWLQARQGMLYNQSPVRSAQQVLDRVNLRVDLDTSASDASGCTLTPADPGVAGALGALAADLATADARGTLQRLKICNAPDCGFVFYDPLAKPHVALVLHEHLWQPRQDTPVPPTTSVAASRPGVQGAPDCIPDLLGLALPRNRGPPIPLGRVPPSRGFLGTVSVPGEM